MGSGLAAPWGAAVGGWRGRGFAESGLCSGEGVGGEGGADGLRGEVWVVDA